MSKVPKRGGLVRISGCNYAVVEPPVVDGDWYLIMVFSEAHQAVAVARSERWRGGCGPWRLVK